MQWQCTSYSTSYLHMSHVPRSANHTWCMGLHCITWLCNGMECMHGMHICRIGSIEMYRNVSACQIMPGYTWICWFLQQEEALWLRYVIAPCCNVCPLPQCNKLIKVPLSKQPPFEMIQPKHLCSSELIVGCIPLVTSKMIWWICTVGSQSVWQPHNISPLHLKATTRTHGECHILLSSQAKTFGILAEILSPRSLHGILVSQHIQ